MFQYNRGVGSFTGNAYLYYEINNSGTWVQIASTAINVNCNTVSATINQGVVPAGALVKFRMQTNWNGGVGGTSVFIDNFKAIQQPFVSVYNFDNSYNDTLGTNSFSAANTSFVADRFGNANSALKITGSAGSTANIPLIPKGNNPRTISIWYKTSVNNSTLIFSYGAAAENQMFGLYLATTGNNGNPNFQCFVNDKNFGGTYAANTWHHAVITFDGSTVKMYMNGILIGTQAYTLNTGGNADFKLGGGSNTLTVDNLDIYSVALDDNEVANLYVYGNLPVELSSFTAQLSNRTTNLLWSSATEINTSHFDIEYSNNGSEFAKVGSVQAQGNSSTAKQYSYQHTINEQPIHFYRLKMVDKDGKFAYSNIVRLKVTVKFFEASVYPTVVTNAATLSITSKEKGNATITVTSMDGKRMLQKNIVLIEGSQTIPLHLENLTKGSYIVSIRVNDSIESYTIIKQ
ncbi:MAG: T9SS type A sorting domain-containing protein [Chitinophagaceae bacterium]|nr:T9SS type A sorting domain-containing protein [Chitinophagaceae bacterium]MCW5906085.1 T9SS type A sorting domain-containing protein [Chitinophagaceae bacterium]